MAQTNSNNVVLAVISLPYDTTQIFWFLVAERLYTGIASHVQSICVNNMLKCGLFQTIREAEKLKVEVDISRKGPVLITSWSLRIENSTSHAKFRDDLKFLKIWSKKSK